MFFSNYPSDLDHIRCRDCVCYFLPIIFTSLSLSDFSISGHGTRKLGKTSQFRIPSQPLFVGRVYFKPLLFRENYFLSIVFTIAVGPIFRFWATRPRNQVKTSFTALIRGPMFTKPYTLFLIDLVDIWCIE